MKPRNNTAPLVEVDSLTVDFWNRDRWVNVVNNVSFQVHPGEAVGLVGESGCGKTTTAYTLLGYRRPNSRINQGQVRYAGQDLLKLPASSLQHLRGKRISLVPQNPTVTLSPGMRIGQQITEVLSSHGIGAQSEREKHTLDLLTDVRWTAAARRDCDGTGLQS
jgi:peptide/nickel transport system ATP-binding protein